MASRLQPRRKDAAKTNRSLFLWSLEQIAVGYLLFRWGQSRAHGLYTFRSTEGTAGPKESICYGSWNCRWPPSFHWGQSRAHGLYAFSFDWGYGWMCCGSWSCRWAPFVPLRARRGPQTLHFSFHWRHGWAERVICYRSWNCRWPLFFPLRAKPGPRNLSVPGLETVVGHLSFRWGQSRSESWNCRWVPFVPLWGISRAHGLYTFRSTDCSGCLMFWASTVSPNYGQLVFGNPCLPLYRGVGGTRALALLQYEDMIQPNSYRLVHINSKYCTCIARIVL